MNTAGTIGSKEFNIEKYKRTHTLRGHNLEVRFHSVKLFSEPFPGSASRVVSRWPLFGKLLSRRLDHRLEGSQTQRAGGRAECEQRRTLAGRQGNQLGPHWTISRVTVSG